MNKTYTLPAAKAGTPYEYKINAGEGVSPYTFKATGLPEGLTMNAASGLISGTANATRTPTAAMNFLVTVVVTGSNAVPQSASRKFNLTVNPSDPPKIITTNLEDGSFGSEYSDSIEVTGGKSPYKFTTKSILPKNLVLGIDGSVTGTPTVVGDFKFSVTVTGADGRASSKTVSLKIADVPLPKITTAMPLYASVNSSFSTALVATTGTGPFTYKMGRTSLTNGSLNIPAGLSLSETGVLSGTPTLEGSFSFPVIATDSLGKSGTTVIKMMVIKALDVKSTVLPSAMPGSPYSQPLEGIGGVPPYKWSLKNAGNLPAGFKVSASGLVTGNVTTVGNHTFTVDLSDSRLANAVTVTKEIAIPVVGYNLEISQNGQPLQPAIVGQAISAVTFTATGGKLPYSWSANPVPSGLALGASTGVLSGIPTTAANTTFTLTVTDANKKTANRTLTWGASAPAAFGINPSVLPSGRVMEDYTANITASGGILPLTVNATGMPPGLAYANSKISGKPTVPGNFTVNFTVKDSSKPTAKTWSTSRPIQIAPYGMEVSGPGTASVKRFESLALAFNAIGGKEPYVWSTKPESGF